MYKYENRIVAFIDLLGFKEAVYTKQCEDIHRAIECFHAVAKKKQTYTKTRHVTQFSDSIVISALATEPSAVFFLLIDIQYMIGDLIQHGFLCRGGICLGDLLHNSKYLFGSGIIKAYQMENSKASFPRVIVDNDVILLAKKYHAPQNRPNEETEYVKRIISCDNDGYFFIDYFESYVKQFAYIQNVSHYLIMLEEFIRKMAGNEKLESKKNWLIQKYNTLLEQLKKGLPYSDQTGQKDDSFNKYIQNLPYMK